MSRAATSPPGFWVKQRTPRAVRAGFFDVRRTVRSTLSTIGGSDTLVPTMITRISTGISLVQDGTIRVVELHASLQSVTLKRTSTYTGEGESRNEQWGSGLQMALQDGYTMERLVLGLPSADTFRRSLSFPFQGRRRISQVLLSELEGEIPVSPEQIVADFLISGSDRNGSRGMAIATRTETLKGVLDILPSGTVPVAIQTETVGLATAAAFSGLKDGAIVLCEGSSCIGSGFHSGSVVSLRRLKISGDLKKDVNDIADLVAGLLEGNEDVILACGGLLEPLLSALGSEGITRVKTPGELEIFRSAESAVAGDPGPYLPALGLALRGLGRQESLTLDLRQGPFRAESPLGQMRRPAARTAIILGAVFVLGLGNLVFGYTAAKSHYESYSRVLETSFRSLFPDTKIVSEVAQIQEKITTLERRTEDLAGFSGAGALAVLAELSSAIPRDLALEVAELSLDSGRLRLDGTVSSFDAVDRIKSILEESAVFKDVKVQNARVGADASKVSFRLQMEVN
ncbi:hypothetical protein EP232_04055 [bacterium]|nr:MAG: hypothetical protein EP232_04055 [bacterium]